MLITSTAVNNKTVATEALSTPGEPEMYADHIKYMYSESYNKVHVTTNLVRRRSKTAKCQTHWVSFRGTLRSVTLKTD